MGRAALGSAMSREKAASKASASAAEAQAASSGDETDASSIEISMQHSAGAGPKVKKDDQKKGKKAGSAAKYVMSSYVQETHEHPVFAVQFNYYSRPEEPMVFATAGGPQVAVYECAKGGGIRFLQSFADADPEENFYTCVWTVAHENFEPLLAAAGQRGIIRIIGMRSLSCIKHFSGHGGAINDLKIHPKDPNLLLSASKDHSLRLWNIRTDVCVSILAGVDGHRDEVLNCDFNHDGSLIASCGIDHAIKVWRLDQLEMQDAIARSYTHNNQSSRTYSTYCNNFADFSTRNIHSNYVDCVKWFGQFILSKSCENSIMCWKPGPLSGNSPAASNNGQVTKIHKFVVKECEIWFVRFSMDLAQKVLVVGNQVGCIFVWNLDVEDASMIKRTMLTHPKCTTPVRQTHVSRDGTVILASCDDGTVWRWDLNTSSAA